MSSRFFDWVSQREDVYPKMLVIDDFQDNPNLIDEIMKYEYMFYLGDLGFRLKNIKTKQFLSGALALFPDTFCWCALDIDDGFSKLPYPEIYDIPTVGFVGQCPVVQTDHGIAHIEGFRERTISLFKLMEEFKVCCDFHPRFHDYSKWYFNLPEERQKCNTPLFYINMKGNVYNLCVRGAGNYSQRLYETLASGRIPIYVESGGRLPFDHMHDYLSDPPFVYVTDLDKISETVVEFHETHDLKVQMDKCYELFKNHFTSDAQIRDFKKMV